MLVVVLFVLAFTSSWPTDDPNHVFSYEHRTIDEFAYQGEQYQGPWRRTPGKGIYLDMNHQIK